MSKAKAAAPPAETNTAMLQEIQRHLPHNESLGTFYLGKRLTTPTGRDIASRRPNSAIASRTSGISVGAAERPASSRLLTATSPRATSSRGRGCSEGVVTPFTSSDVTHWLSTRQKQLHVNGTGREELSVATGTGNRLLKLIGNESLLWETRENVFEGGNERSTYPSLAVGLDDSLRRGAVDRLSTLLRAIALLKQRIETDEDGASDMEEVLCHAFCVGTDVRGRDTVFGANYNSKHIALAVGSSVYCLTLFGSDNVPFSSYQIKESINGCIAHAASSNEETLFRASLLPIRDWSEKVQLLRNVGRANANTLELLNRALLMVTLMPQDEVAPPACASNTTTRYSACGTQLAMYANGQAILQSSSLFVTSSKLVSCAEWISRTANEDPMVSTARSAVSTERTLTAVRRILPPSRPTTAPGKGKAAVAAAAEVEPLEETTSIVQVVQPAAVSSVDWRPLQLWLPIQQRLEAERAIRHHNPSTASHVFEFSWGPPRLLILSLLAALAKVLPRSTAPLSALPPLVRLSCSDHKPSTQSWLCAKEIDCMLGLLRGAEAGTWNLHHPTRETVESVRRASRFVDDNILSTLEGTSPDVQAYHVARSLLKRKLVQRTSLLNHGESCGPADVVVCVSTAATKHFDARSGLAWFAESACAAVDGRMSLSFCNGGDGSLVCVLTHLSEDAEIAFQLSHTIQTTASTLRNLLQ